MEGAAMEEIKIARILCPVDYSEFSDCGLAYALHLAERFGAELMLLHVVEVPYVPAYGLVNGTELVLPVGDLERGAGEYMDELVERCSGQCARVQGEIRTGFPLSEIIAYTREIDADLIVMGTHGRTGLSHVLIGSVAEKVVRKAPCPVLTVKHPKHSFQLP